MKEGSLERLRRPTWGVGEWMIGCGSARRVKSGPKGVGLRSTLIGLPGPHRGHVRWPDAPITSTSAGGCRRLRHRSPIVHAPGLWILAIDGHRGGGLR